MHTLPSASTDGGVFAPVVPLAGLDAAWCDVVLRRAGLLAGGTVTSVTPAPLGAGQTADSFRLTLTYAGVPGPPTLIAKLPAADSRSARLGGAGGLYRGEVMFYSKLAAGLPVATAGVVHAAAGLPAEFTLILEDLAPAAPVDQLVGCSADQAALAVEQAAALHSHSWRDQRLAGLPWLRSIIEAFCRVAERLPTLAARFEREFDGVIPDADLRAALRLVDLADPWRRVLRSATCLWHADFRADNLLFGARGGAVGVAVLDWQTLGYGPGLADVSLFLGGSLTVADRRAHESDLLRLYHSAMVAGGVRDLTFEQCRTHYRLLSVHGVFNALNGAVQVERTERGDQMWRTWVQRHVAHVLDHDGFSLLAQQ